jgi:hypothetical protein
MTCPVTTHSHRLAFLLGPLVGTLLLCVTSFNFINIVSSVVYAVVLPYAAIASTYLYFDLRVAKHHEAGQLKRATSSRSRRLRPASRHARHINSAPGCRMPRSLTSPVACQSSSSPSSERSTGRRRP